MSVLPQGWKWFHVTGNTYGTWLPGDPRGWRSRKHKVHVDGDYRDPPAPGAYDHLNAHSRSLLTRDAVLLTPDQRRVAGRAMVDRLLELNVRLLALSCGRAHYHLLGGFSDHEVRQLVGRAKKNATFDLRECGFEGRAWARKSRPLPVGNRAHQRNVFEYILDHAREGAWVWSFRDGRSWNPEGKDMRRGR
jgi:REP element-mobilizing transposase RayT